MKVVFKITPAQQLFAFALAAAINQKVQEEVELHGLPYRACPCGTFNVLDTGYGVRRQDLTVQEGRLTYEGGRTTLVNGALEALSLIEKIFGSREAATASVVGYETTADYLQWFEIEEAALSRASSERLCKVAESMNSAAGLEAIRQLRLKYQGLIGKSPAFLSASLVRDELAMANKAITIIKEFDRAYSS